ncbi:hypothetical protein [Mesonia aquimarina]|nr:hypothetical protein [Mesonia aquimarina]
MKNETSEKRYIIKTDAYKKTLKAKQDEMLNRVQHDSYKLQANS